MDGISFSQLSNESKINRLTTPMLVPLTDNPDGETEDMIVSRHEKFLQLDFRTKEKLASVKTSQKIQLLGQKYGFELLRLANITRLIREYYFGEVRLENFPAEIEKRMGVSLLTAQEITRYLKQEIIDWDPWAEYVAKLPKMSIREIFEKKLKIADMEITSGYVELRGSDDLLDPTIKNWVQDYVSHLGYEKHSQMQRTQYLFHSENGRDLSSQDREKLSIILRSFDENIPLPIDDENGEIVFDSVENKVGDGYIRPAAAANAKAAYTRPLRDEQPIPQSTPDSFIKPYSPTQQPPRQAPRPTSPPPTQTPPPAKIQYKATTSDPELNKYFQAPETSEIPEIKIHGMTEHNEPKPMPQSLPPRPTQPIVQRPIQPPVESRPQHRIIEPFSGRFNEPRLDGNIVDLSNIEE